MTWQYRVNLDRSYKFNRQSPIKTYDEKEIEFINETGEPVAKAIELLHEADPERYEKEARDTRAEIVKLNRKLRITF